MDEKRPRDRKSDVEIGPLGKDGEKLIASIRAGNMVGILSGAEVMYTFLYRGKYQCFIHPLAAEEGRHKDWAVNEKNTAMIKNLANLADQLFEIKFGAQMRRKRASSSFWTRWASCRQTTWISCRER